MAWQTLIMIGLAVLLFKYTSAQTTPLRYACHVIDEEEDTYTCWMKPEEDQEQFVLDEQLRFRAIHIYGWQGRYGLHISNAYVR